MSDSNKKKQSYKFREQDVELKKTEAALKLQKRRRKTLQKRNFPTRDILEKDILSNDSEIIKKEKIKRKHEHKNAKRLIQLQQQSRMAKTDQSRLDRTNKYKDLINTLNLKVLNRKNLSAIGAQSYSNMKTFGIQLECHIFDIKTKSIIKNKPFSKLFKTTCNIHITFQATNIYATHITFDVPNGWHIQVPNEYNLNIRNRVDLVSQESDLQQGLSPNTHSDRSQWLSPDRSQWLSPDRSQWLSPDRSPYISPHRSHYIKKQNRLVWKEELKHARFSIYNNRIVYNQKIGDPPIKINYPYEQIRDSKQVRALGEATELYNLYSIESSISDIENFINEARHILHLINRDIYSDPKLVKLINSCDETKRSYGGYKSKTRKSKTRKSKTRKSKTRKCKTRKSKKTKKIEN